MFIGAICMGVVIPPIVGWAPIGVPSVPIGADANGDWKPMGGPCAVGVGRGGS